MEDDSKNKIKDDMKEEISAQILESINVCSESVEKNKLNIKKAVEMIIKCYKNNGRVIIFGNGASAADAQHIVAEFVNKMNLERPTLDAVALTVNTSVLTAIANDSSFEDIFSRQLETFAGEKDIVMVLSASGTSQNIIKGVKKAKESGISVISLTGENEESVWAVKGSADVSIDVCSKDTARIQEAHILIGHIICTLVESELFDSSSNSETILDRIDSASKESVEVKQRMKENLVDKIEKSVKITLETYKNKGRLIVFGNGGSAADAQHIASQLVNKLYLDRPMLDALALNINSSIITAIGNDSSYDNVFSRQIESLAKKRRCCSCDFNFRKFSKYYQSC